MDGWLASAILASVAAFAVPPLAMMYGTAESEHMRNIGKWGLVTCVVMAAPALCRLMVSAVVG